MLRRKPKQGETRIRRCFAYLPVKVRGKNVWLRWYRIREEYYEEPFWRWIPMVCFLPGEDPDVVIPIRKVG